MGRIAIAFPQGINFRATVGYVTDGANDSFQCFEDPVSYPNTTAQGNTVGWEQGVAFNHRNRDSGNDPRLAGINFSDTQKDFRIDLPSAGDYKIGLAAGDASYATGSAVSLLDTTTSLGSLSTGSTSAANSFNDATDTEYTAANWVTSQTLVNKTFATTICRFRLPGTTEDSIAHAYVEAAGGAANRIRFPAEVSGMGVGGQLGGNRVN